MCLTSRLRTKAHTQTVPGGNSHAAPTSRTIWHLRQFRVFFSSVPFDRDHLGRRACAARVRAGDERMMGARASSARAAWQALPERGLRDNIVCPSTCGANKSRRGSCGNNGATGGRATRKAAQRDDDSNARRKPPSTRGDFRRSRDDWARAGNNGGTEACWRGGPLSHPRRPAACGGRCRRHSAPGGRGGTATSTLLSASC